MRKILSVVSLLSLLVLGIFAAGCIVSPTPQTNVTAVNLTGWYLTTPVQYAQVNGVEIGYRDFGTANADPSTNSGVYRESIAIKESVPVIDQLGNVTLDVLVIVGTEDDLTPVEGNFAVAEKNPRSLSCSVPGIYTWNLDGKKPYETAHVVTAFYQNTVTAIPVSSFFRYIIFPWMA